MDVHVTILDDTLPEGEERFTVELTAFDLSIILVESVAEVVIMDDDSEHVNSILNDIISFTLFLCSTFLSAATYHVVFSNLSYSWNLKHEVLIHNPLQLYFAPIWMHLIMGLSPMMWRLAQQLSMDVMKGLSW